MKYEYIFNKKVKAVATLKPGEKITVNTEDAFRGLIKKEKNCTMKNIESILDLSNPLTGPIVVDEAEPGDWLEVVINDIECGPYGVSIIGSHFSIFGDRYKIQAKVVPIKNGVIDFNDKIKIKVKPMIGTIGTTPELDTPLSTMPGIFGGNMDASSVSIGNKLYLPVFINGGYLYLGDCHAIQGDGELVNPFEIPAKITLTINIVKDKTSKGKWPRVISKDTIETIVSDRTFYFAAKEALDEMIKWLSEDYGFNSTEAAFLCGQVADARCCQIGNAYHTVRCVFPQKYLKNS